MKPMTAGLAAALVSGVVMYTVGAKADSLNAFNQSPALVQTADGQFVVPANSLTALRPAAVPAAAPATTVRSTRTAAASRRTVDRAPQRSTRDIVREDDRREIDREDDRSWGKTAMIVGGGAASGAGVGGIVGGKKGALIGAAIGGGAASIYEATQRR
jgi:hypothetical protein